MIELTISQIADMFQAERRTISTNASRIRRMRGNFGRKLNTRTYVFSLVEVEELRPKQRGWPKGKKRVFKTEPKVV